MAHIKQVDITNIGSYLIEPTLYAAASVSSDGTTYTASFNNNFELIEGVCVQIKCPNKTNTAPTTFNTKSIYYNGEAIASNTLKANHTYALVYDGVQWELVGDIDTDTVYTHPTTDGNLHVPATGTTNDGKFLKAGSSAGSISWQALTKNDITDFPTEMTPSSHTHGNVQNDGTLSTASYAVVTDANKKITVEDLHVDDPNVVNNVTGTSFISNIATNEKGKITTLIKKNLPTASTSVAGITTVGASGGAAAYDHNHDSTYAAKSHTHGNIQNDGKLQTTDVAIADGDKLVITDATDSNKIARTSLTFDGTTATKALTQKGTWETFNNYSLPLAANGTRGGIQIGFTTNATNRNYAVQLDSEKAYVNVPWTDQNVTQSADTSNVDIPILLKGTTGNATVGAVKYPNTTDKVVSVNPSTGSIIAPGGFIGNASTATKFNSTRKIELTGAITGSATTDGSNGWTISTSVNHNHNASYVTSVGYDSENKKIYYTKNGSNTDVVTFGSNAFNSTEYLSLAGGIMTGNIRRYYSAASTEPMITMLSSNQDILLWEAGHGTAAATTTTSNHYKLLYKGTGTDTDNSNYLQLIAHKTSDLIAVQIDEVGNVSLPQMNKGNATKPIYLNNGVITEGTALKDLAYIAKPSNNTTTTYLRGDGSWVSLSDMGLSNALHFIGVTSTELSDGSTTSTLTAKSTNSLNKTTGFVDGDVVMDGDQLREYVWSGSAWRLLGITTSSTYIQPATVANNTWISQITQGTDGKITATTGSLVTTGTWNGKAGSLTDIGSNDAANSTDTWRRIWFSYNDNKTGRPAYSDKFVFQTSTNTLKIDTGTLTATDYSGNAATATKLKDDASNTTASFWRGDNSWSNEIASALGASTAILKISTSKSISSSYVWGLTLTVPNLASGANAIGVMTGQAMNAGNAGYLNFHYVGNNHNDNYVSLGIFSNDNLLKVYKTGNVSIGADNNNYKLYINGTTYLGGNTTLEGSSTISRAGKSINWNAASAYAPFRMTSKAGWSPLWALKSTSGWWTMGHYDASGFSDHLLFTLLADVDVAGVSNAKNHMDYTVRLIPTIYATNTTTTTDRAFVTAPWASSKAAVGSTKKPVYIDDNGVATEISYTIEKSVPSNAVFTDHYAWSDITSKPTSIALTGAVTATATTLGSGAISIETTVNHGHGNITSNGAAGQTANWSLANGDGLLVFDASNSNKIERSGITFDGSTETKALTPKGTWVTFNNYSHPTSAGNKHIPSGGSAGQFLKYGGSSGTASWSALPTASTDAAGIIQIGTGSTNAMAGNTVVNTVKTTAKTDDVEYKLLMSAGGASLTSGTNYEAVYDTNITVNTNTHTITATNFNGNATTATTATNLASAPTIIQTGTSTIDLVANTTYTLTIGGKSVVFKTPSDSDVDYRTRQNTLGDTDTTNRPLLLSYYENTAANSNTARVTYRNSRFYANMTSGILYAPTFSGNLTGDVTGNADTATNATNDSDGNAINTTYVKKVTSTDNAIVRFDGTDGTVQDSTSTINDNGTMTINGRLIINPKKDTSSQSYNEGIRINQSTNGWANIQFGGADESTSGTEDGQWLAGRRGAAGSKVGAIGDFSIEEQNSIGGGLTIHKDNGGVTFYSKLAYNKSQLKIWNDNSIAAGNFGYAINAVSTMAATANSIILVGAANSSKNQAYLGFHYEGSGSNNNYLTLGLYGVNHLLKIFPTGQVNITTNVASSSTSTGSLVVAGGTGIAGKLYVGSTATVDILTITNTGVNPHINFSRTGTTTPNYINVPASSALGFSVGGATGANIRLQVNNTSVDSWTDNTVDLGTSSIQWKSIHSYKYVVEEKVTLQWNATDQSLDFIFA